MFPGCHLLTPRYIVCTVILPSSWVPRSCPLSPLLGPVLLWLRVRVMLRFLSRALVFLAFPPPPPLLLFAINLPCRLATAADNLSGIVNSDLLLLSCSHWAPDNPCTDFTVSGATLMLLPLKNPFCLQPSMATHRPSPAPVPCLRPSAWSPFITLFRNVADDL
jgi:hypothetical protein